MGSEVTRAIDVLNILLYDDNAFPYFGLQHMPGLLDVLLDHLRRGLLEMFNVGQDLEPSSSKVKRIKIEEASKEKRLDGENIIPEGDKTRMLPEGENDFTLVTRTGKNVTFVPL